MKTLLTLVLGGLLVANIAPASDLPPGDRDAGRKLAGQCRTCHGLDGFAKIPIAPHIGGEPAPYLQAQLMAFRDGTREHEMMTVVARDLTDQNISDLAAWFAGHTAIATLTDDGENAPAACIACHGTNGIGQADDVPNLAGETNIYIDTQLKAFRNGKRQHDIMTVVAEQLDDTHIREIADWYAAIKLEIETVE